MTEIITVPIDDIFVDPDRLREIKPEVVQTYATRMRAGDQYPPLQVRRTPNGEGKFTLVSGLHRLKAHAALQAVQVEAYLIKANADQAREQEIAENLLRNELTALERIYHVAEWRRLFEAAHGKVARGNPEFAKTAKLAELDLLGNIEDSQEGSFFSRLAERLGLTRRTSERYFSISKHLQPALKAVLTGSALEDNQAVIERLSKLEPAIQLKYAKLLSDNGGDIGKADEALFPKRPLTRDERYYEGICDNWTRTNARVRAKFVADYIKPIGEMLASDEALLKAFAATHKDALKRAMNMAETLEWDAAAPLVRETSTEPEEAFHA
jgi:ParB family transcriptional regulator, chromosome partitioning protein